MVRNLPHLRRVDLSWNSSLTDDAITVLCRSCPGLREVTISGLKRITSKPFLPIITDVETWRERRDVIKARLRQSVAATDFVTRERDISRLEVSCLYPQARHVYRNHLVWSAMVSTEGICTI